MPNRVRSIGIVVVSVLIGGTGALAIGQLLESRNEQIAAPTVRATPNTLVRPVAATKPAVDDHAERPPPAARDGCGVEPPWSWLRRSARADLARRQGRDVAPTQPLFSATA